LSDYTAIFRQKFQSTGKPTTESVIMATISQ